jgi:predicted regulator of Ras-like GTPase activity (Roadblock/LC7/MglB family)
MTLTQQLSDRLKGLVASSSEIEAAALVSTDGLPIASVLPEGVEDDRLAAMSAAMLSLGEQITQELGRGSLDQVFIKGSNGYVILMSISDNIVLAALAREQAKLGLILLEMRRTAGDLRIILQ